MVSVCKLGGTINQTGVKGGKSKRSKIPPQSLSFSFSPSPRFSRFAGHHSPLVRSRDVRSIALKTLGKERDCSQSIVSVNLCEFHWGSHLAISGHDNHEKIQFTRFIFFQVWIWGSVWWPFESRNLY